MRTLVRWPVMLSLLCLLSTAEVNAGNVPQMINVQGVLTNMSDSVVADGSYSVAFTIYDALTGGSIKWTETRAITTKGGVFTVALGESTPIAASLFATTELWLGIKVGGDPEMTPRQRLISVPYAMQSPATAAGSDYWTVTDSVLQTNKWWGLARGDAGNVLIGDNAHTMVNFGVACTTGFISADISYSTVGGGNKNVASAQATTVCGGRENIAFGNSAAVGGGAINHAYGTFSVVGGGLQNYAGGDYATITGGYADTITSTGDYSYLFGIKSKLTQDSTFMVDMPHIHFGDEANGYEFPTVDGAASQIIATDGSGQLSWVNPSGGPTWTVTNSVLYTNDWWGIARGGAGNSIYGDSAHTMVNLGASCVTGVNGLHKHYATISGGKSNTALGDYSTVCGGTNNIAGDNYSVVAGGLSNDASGNMSAILGGSVNKATGQWSAVPGGWKNEATGDFSLAAGANARARHQGSVVISANSSSQVADSVYSGGIAQMVLRADSGIYITNDSGLAVYDPTRLINTSSGAYLSADGKWTDATVKELKENFTPVDGIELLEKIAALPITEWNYKAEEDQVKHIGPMAQDFYALFGLGNDNKSISTVDPSGVALAGIKQLIAENQKLKELVTRLEERIAKLENE